MTKNAVRVFWVWKRGLSVVTLGYFDWAFEHYYRNLLHAIERFLW